MEEKNMVPQAQKVGKVANLVIFLGILGVILSIIALTISNSLAQRGYGTLYILTGMFMIGLGYGIRHRYKYCLLAALILFLVLSCSFLYRFVVHHTTYLLIRLSLSTWVSYRLFQSVSSMRILIETNTFPDKTNRFIGFLSRQKKHDNFG
ncbi:MAG: hypothetical protein E3K37_06200 [Candidatus Kuenenia sp.]|nr:hypothetical protein [Candidatus Kuenenia hertensis]